MNELWNGDCLELMHKIPDGSVDMILCDLPYGTTACSWDSVIPFDALWSHYRRLIKPNGAIVLTASQPFTTALIASNMKEFKYCWVWEKTRGSNPALVKKQPWKKHEDICVFGKKSVNYYPLMQIGRNAVKSGRGASKKVNGIDGGGFNIFHNKEKIINNEYYPSSVIKVKSMAQSEVVHPTQKPVALFEYLIKTYTNPGETVLDNCAGSGTTAIACMNTQRNYICIERDETYYERAKERIRTHNPPML